MEVVGKKIESLPFQNLKLVNELLNFEGEPLLLHYKANENSDVLAYWVDFNEDVNRWLFFKVSKQELYQYLSGVRSLKEILSESESGYFFLVDYNWEQKSVNETLIDASLLPAKYYPKDGSVYMFGLSDYYYKYLEADYYLSKLREKSFIFNVEPANSKHGKTVGALEGGQLLTGITKSVRAYVEYEVNDIFKKIITNNKTLTKFIKKVVDLFSPRMPIVAYGSFEVGIAIDTTHTGLDYNVDFDWRERIVEGYKRDVLDVNYANEAEATLISQRFDAESRKRIYEPFIKILENPEIKISVKSPDRSLENDYSRHPVKDSFKRIVVPKPTKEEEEEKQVRLVTLTVALQEGEDLSRINVKKLREGLLFGDIRPETDYIIHSPFQHGGITLNLKKDIKSVFELEPNGIQRIYNTELDLLAEGDKFKDVERSFKDELLRLFNEYAEAKEQGKEKGDTRFLELEKHIDV